MEDLQGHLPLKSTLNSSVLFIRLNWANVEIYPPYELLDKSDFRNCPDPLNHHFPPVDCDGST